MRRGAQTLSMEVFIALAVAAVMIIFMLTYIESQSDSTGYFQRFYIKDLSLMGEVVSGAPGNAVVTYDNLREMNFTYEVTRGLVTITYGEHERRGVFGVYRDLVVSPAKFLMPSFLTFIKSGDYFTVSEDIGYLQGCSLRDKSFDPDPAIVSEAFPALSAGAREVYPEQMGNSIPTFVLDEESNLVFMVDFEEGENQAAITVPSGEEFGYVGCLLKNQIQSLSPGEVTLSTGGQNISIVIQKRDEWLEERLLGQMIGRAVLQYDRQ